ncbi:hypothetical protein ZWY2020_055040 [Hordeum vulgare]|nr:hypothetical protein ZWY2020_055040 [Hordeum vulgare]
MGRDTVPRSRQLCSGQPFSLLAAGAAAAVPGVGVAAASSSPSDSIDSVLGCRAAREVLGVPNARPAAAAAVRSLVRGEEEGIWRDVFV